MEKRNWNNDILAYLDGSLSPAERIEFEQQLTADTALQKEMEDYKVLFNVMAMEPTIKPSGQLTTNFEKMVAAEKANQVKVVSIGNKPKNGPFQLWRVAASIAVLIGVFFLGRYSEQRELQQTLVTAQEEVLQYKEATLVSLLGNESASKRIQGVQLLKEFEQPDEDIVAALGEKMLGDQNANVRLSAMEALSRFSYSDQVKAFFIRALETEDQPNIQVALIEILGQLQEKKAIAPMKKLLEKEDIQPFIKEEINNAIPKII